MKVLRIVFVGGYFCAAMLPLIWLLLTSFKTRDDSIAVHPKFVRLLGLRRSRLTGFTFALISTAIANWPRCTPVGITLFSTTWATAWLLACSAPCARC